MTFFLSMYETCMLDNQQVTYEGDMSLMCVMIFCMLIALLESFGTYMYIRDFIPCGNLQLSVYEHALCKH